MSIAIKGDEITFSEDIFIVSKTDLKGKITYCNDTFIDICGYKEDELIGKPHNIIRHKDMPRVVFKLLWDKIQAGEETALGHDVDDLSHEPVFERLGIFRSRPDPVVVRLAGQPAYSAGGGADVADEQTQRARKPEFAEAFEPLAQERAHGLPAYGLVAVQQHRDEERRPARAGQMDEGRRAEPFGESPAVGLQKSVGQ